MKRKLGEQRAKALQLRLSELRAATEMGDLLYFGGKWEEKTGDRSGEWGAHLTKNWRLIVKPEGNSRIVRITEIVDYH